jgi:hypothetical protein
VIAVQLAGEPATTQIIFYLCQYNAVGSVYTSVIDTPLTFTTNYGHGFTVNSATWPAGYAVPAAAVAPGQP